MRPSTKTVKSTSRSRDGRSGGKEDRYTLPKRKEIGDPNTEGTPEGNDRLGLMLLGVTGDQTQSSGIPKIKAETLKQVQFYGSGRHSERTQNTCIFSTEFALRLMGDVREYFIQQQIRNFYSVSISGYPHCRSGANPITQLAFTLCQWVYLCGVLRRRGWTSTTLEPNLSFFFSNGIDPEYSVMGV